MEPSASPQAAAAAARQVSRLEATGLRKSYGSRLVVEDVSLAVESGEVVGLLGPNGAGKTTSFYMIVGLVRADAGRISIDGQGPVGEVPLVALEAVEEAGILGRAWDAVRLWIK